MKRLAIALIGICMAASASAQFVDLGESMLFVRVGFEDAWTRALPRLDDEAWTIVQPTRGERSLALRDLGLPGAPAGGPLTLVSRPPLEYTVLAPFQADLTLLNASDPALFLKHAGQEWAVYLNGVLLRSEFRRSGGGYAQRSLRNVVVPLDKRRLSKGQNMLAFRIRGDPVDDTTGFDSPGPYVIGSYRKLVSAHREYLDLMLIGVYAFFALYHGVLFAMRPKDRGYLYFGAATLLSALYLSARTSAATSLVVDTAALLRIERASLFLALPAILAFLEFLLQRKTSRFVALLAAFSSALALAGLFLRPEPLRLAWYVAAAASIVRALVLTVGSSLSREYRELRSGRDSPSGARSRAASIGALLWRSDSGRIAIGCVVLAAGAIVDAALSGGAEASAFWSKNAFFVFILLTASALAGQFIKVSQRAEAMNAGLEAEVEERTAELSAAAKESVRLNEDVASANVRLTEVMEESERDLRIAAAVQKGFFPARPPAVDDWDLAFAFEPASGVSGDFYDFMAEGGSLTHVVAGSVSGSGIASGLVTVLVKNIFNRGVPESSGEPVAAVLGEINRALSRELSAVGNTVSCSFLRLKGPRVEYVNAAHTDALLRRSGQRDVSVIKPKDGPRRAPPLGRDDYSGATGALGFSVAPGDAILVYTAGLVDSVNAKKAPYGAARLVEAFGRADPENAESLLASVMIDYRNYVAGARRSGDITVIALVKR